MIFEQKDLLRREYAKGKHLQKADGKTFSFQLSVNLLKHLQHQALDRLLGPSLERKHVFLNLFNNNKKDVLAQQVCKDPRLKRMNSEGQMLHLPYNDSGVNDIFMTREKADLDVW